MPRELKPGREIDTEVEILCATCGIQTRHRVLHSVVQPVFEIDGEDEWGEEEKVAIGDMFSETLVCAGCDSITFARRSQGYQMAPKQWLYPRRSQGRPELPDLYLLARRVRSIYSESHRALANKQQLLAALGIRTLVEAVCREKNAPGANLKQRIAGLVEVGAFRLTPLLVVTVSATSDEVTRFPAADETCGA